MQEQYRSPQPDPNEPVRLGDTFTHFQSGRVYFCAGITRRISPDGSQQVVYEIQQLNN